METEREPATKLFTAEYRSKNVQSFDKVLTPQIDTLPPKIWSVASQYKRSRRRAAYLDVINFDQREGDAVCTRKRTAQSGQTGKLLWRLDSALLPQSV